MLLIRATHDSSFTSEPAIVIVLENPATINNMRRIGSVMVFGRHALKKMYQFESVGPELFAQVYALHVAEGVRVTGDTQEAVDLFNAWAEENGV